MTPKLNTDDEQEVTITDTNIVLTDRAGRILEKLVKEVGDPPELIVEDVLASALAHIERKRSILFHNGEGMDKTGEPKEAMESLAPEGDDPYKWMRFAPITQLEDRLFLGGYADVRYPAELKKLGITAIANVSHVDLGAHKHGFKSMVLGQVDGTWIAEDLIVNFLRWMEEHWNAGDTILIHCHAGISRTIAFTIAWRLHLRGYNRKADLNREWRQEYDKIAEKRPIADPHGQLRRSILQFFDKRIRMSGGTIVE